MTCTARVILCRRGVGLSYINPTGVLKSSADWGILNPAQAERGDTPSPGLVNLHVRMI
jgi:hypothetical protein